MTLNDIDKIFFLCLANKPERIANVNNIIDNLTNNFSVKDNIKVNYTASLNLTDDEDIVNSISKYLPDYKTNYTHTINMFSCFFNHYNIIAETYFLKYDYILLFEDDAYIEDFNTFNTLLNNIPDDADLIQFVYDPFWTPEENIKNINAIDNSFKNEYFNKINDLHTCSNACLILSSKMINLIYNFYFNGKIVYPDAYQYTYPKIFDNCNVYMPKQFIVNNIKFETTITYA